MIDRYIPEPNGEIIPWTAEITLGQPFEPERVQETVTEYVTESGITVVGLYAPEQRLFSMHTWAETRPDYKPTPSPRECAGAMIQLATRLDATDTNETPLPDGTIQVLMGRKKGGYGEGDEVGIDALHTADWEVLEGHMVSARALVNGSVEPYGELAGRIRAARTQANIDAIGSLADRLEQWHIAIEAETPDKTILYRWVDIPPSS